MKNTLKILGLFALTLALLALIGLYRSRIDHIDYPLAFDRVANGFTSGIWELLHSAIVQTGIMVVIGLLVFRQVFPGVVDRLSELSAGSVSAKFAVSKDILLEINKRSDEEDTSLSKDSDVQDLEAIVKHLSTELCWYLLKVHDKAISVNEHAATIIQETSMKDYGEGIKGFTAIGYFSAIVFNFDHILFDANKDSNNLIFTLKPQVLSLIKQKLKLEEIA